MCLLTFYPATVMPDTAALRHGSYLNDDGHGFAIVAGARLIVRHGMDAGEMIEAFDVARHHYPDGPALFHSRFATHSADSRFELSGGKAKESGRPAGHSPPSRVRRRTRAYDQCS